MRLSKTSAAKFLWALPPILALAGLAAVATGCAGAPSTNHPQTASDVLRQRHAAVAWNAKSLIEADLDQDGGADYAVLGQAKGQVVVGIVHGPVAPGSPVWTLEFPVGGGGEDALCSAEAKLTVEPLGDEAKTRPGRTIKGMGLNLHDDHCDAFHIFWNPDKKKFEYWRL